MQLQRRKSVSIESQVHTILEIQWNPLDFPQLGSKEPSSIGLAEVQILLLDVDLKLQLPDVILARRVQGSEHFKLFGVSILPILNVVGGYEVLVFGIIDRLSPPQLHEQALIKMTILD